MPKCDQCGTIILFGGVRDSGFRFCNQQCHAAGQHFRTALNALPQEAVDEHLLDLHGGACPRCKGAGPIDVYTCHRVWSAVVLTGWNSEQRICCRSCGVKHQLGGIAFCATLGWWGFPFGLVMTPLQIARNVSAMLRPPDPTIPSREMERLVRMRLTAMVLHAQAQAHAAEAAPPTTAAAS